MSVHSTISQPLNETQLMLLRLFSRPISPKELEAISDLLLDYYENMLQKEVDKSIEEKDITRTDFDRVLNEQQRTK